MESAKALRDAPLGGRVDRRRFGRFFLPMVGAGILLFFVVASMVGPPPIPPTAVLAILAHQISGGLIAGPPCGTAAVCVRQCVVWTEIVWLARVPAVLLAIVAGAALGLSGGALQGVFRNPLADPYLLGLSSGAAMGASFLFVFRIGLASANLTLPLFAFLGGLIPGLVVYAAAGRSRSVETLVLTGVALSSFFAAILATLLLLNPVGGIQLSFWLLGGMTGATWDRVGIVFGAVLAAGVLPSLFGRDLNVMQLGSEVALSLGVNPRRVARRLVLVSTVLTASAVAFTGVIGFIGLVSPHIVRRLVGPDYRAVLPLAAVVGGMFLAGAWNLAQVVIPDVVLPVGIPTAFVGAPFFVYLLYRRATRSGGPNP